MSLTIGRIVHYWPRVGEGRRRDMSQPYLARVVYVAKGDVATLVVDDHRGQSFVREDVLPESMMASGIIMQRQPGTWAWPPQAPAAPARAPQLLGPRPLAGKPKKKP